MSAFSSAAFSTSAFSISAFDFGSTPPTPPAGGGSGNPNYHYKTPYSKLREEEYHRKILTEQREELNRIEYELAEAERSRQEQLAKIAVKRMAKNAAKKQAVLEARLQDEINKLLAERAWLIRQIDDEECLLLIMMRKRRRIF